MEIELSSDDYILYTYTEAMFMVFMTPSNTRYKWRLPTWEEYKEHDDFTNHWYHDDPDKTTNATYFVKLVRDI